MSQDAELKNLGWTRRATYDKPRLSEMLQMYEELGFEVLAKPFVADDSQCATCMAQFPEKYKTLYTRKKTEKSN